MAQLLWAFDVGQKFGWASGVPGDARPSSGVWRLKTSAEHPSVAGSNLLHTLNDLWATEKPYMIVKEAPLALQAFKNLGNAAHTVAVTLGLHAIVEAMCVRHGVPFENVHNMTIRKHFTGRGTWGGRDETKRAVVQRCRVLKYVPVDCEDDDRCDALATWDYGAATFGRKRLDNGELYLFGEQAHG